MTRYHNDSLCVGLPGGPIFSRIARANIILSKVQILNCIHHHQYVIVFLTKFNALSHFTSGKRSFTPAKKRGGGTEKVLDMLKGGTTPFDVILTWELEVLAILMGVGAKSFHPLKGGRKRFYPVLRGGGRGTTSFGPAIFPFCSPPPFPIIINDQSLTKWQTLKT